MDLLDKPDRIWNADECGFAMGSKAGKVIGPVNCPRTFQIPHVSGSGSKERLTAMYCANAAGQMMPVFLVYPRPAPAGCNPLNGALPGTIVEYTKKGWMDAVTFCKFILHVDRHAGAARPIALIIDSVSSHVDMKAFTLAVAKGIEIYRLLPNSTHIMQPLDKGVFGALKTQWHKVTRKHARDYPGSKISKANFAEKLTEAFNNFYRPSTIINSFRSTGVYPVDRSRITVDMLAPGTAYREAGDPSTALQLLADVADRQTQHRPTDIAISAAVAAALQLPMGPPRKSPPKTLLNSLPDNLTSTASLRTMALKDLQKIRKLAEREKAAKTRFLRKAAKVTSTEKSDDSNVACAICAGEWQDDQAADKECTWIACDACNRWMHAACTGGVHTADIDTVSFVCQLCLPLPSP